MRLALSLQAGLPASARGSRQRARAAGSSRRGGAVLRAGNPARTATASCAQEARAVACAARPRSRGRCGLRRVLRAKRRARDRSRSRWITCAPIARPRRSTRCATPCVRIRTTSMRCGAWPASTYARRSGSAMPRRCCGARLRGHRTLSWPGRCWPICCAKQDGTAKRSTASERLRHWTRPILPHGPAWAPRTHTLARPRKASTRTPGRSR